MLVDAFDFDLPEELIALRPLAQREEARLLCVEGMVRQDRHINDLSSLLREGDLLIFNDTKVIPAFLKATRPPRDEGGHNKAVEIDITLHKRVDGKTWQAFVKPAKRLRLGDKLNITDTLSSEVVNKEEGGEVTLVFNCSGAALDAAIAETGFMPLPPYIATRRPVDEQDESDYQTIFAKQKGAVAAPTAGLHFTSDLLQQLQSQGVGLARTTLHVGAGTFLPVKVSETSAHKMHAEWGIIPEETASAINETRQKGGRVIAVGTTVLRLLESAVDEKARVHAFEGETDIFITPGYTCRAADLLLTNFHLPRSTLFMLVCAFAGMEPMKAAYAHAIAAQYRFYSYGDACLLRRHDYA